MGKFRQYLHWEIPWWATLAFNLAVIVAGILLYAGSGSQNSAYLAVIAVCVFNGLLSAASRYIEWSEAQSESQTAKANPANQKGEAGASPSTVGDTHLPGGNDETRR